MHNTTTWQHDRSHDDNTCTHMPFPPSITPIDDVLCASCCQCEPRSLLLPRAHGYCMFVWCHRCRQLTMVMTENDPTKSSGSGAHQHHESQTYSTQAASSVSDVTSSMVFVCVCRCRQCHHRHTIATMGTAYLLLLSSSLYLLHLRSLLHTCALPPSVASAISCCPLSLLLHQHYH